MSVDQTFWPCLRMRLELMQRSLARNIDRSFAELERDVSQSFDVLHKTIDLSGQYRIVFLGIEGLNSYTGEGGGGASYIPEIEYVVTELGGTRRFMKAYP